MTTILAAVCALALARTEPIYSQEERVDTLRVELFFRSGEGAIDPQYLDNGERMEELKGQMEGAAVNGTVVLRAGASLEGAVQKNRALSAARAESAEAWLSETFGISDVSRTVVGEDWPGLGEMVKGLDKPWCPEALDIIQNYPEYIVENGKVVGSRKKSLMDLAYGHAWEWLSKSCFPELRKVEVWIPVEAKPEAADADDASGDDGKISEADVAEEATAKDNADEANAEGDANADADAIVSALAAGETAAEASAEGVTPVSTPEKTLAFALRTNLLLPLLNVGAELPIGDRWSVGLDWYYPWLWRKPDHKDCYQALALGLEGRYWFGKGTNGRHPEKLTGHSVGLFSYAGYYDFEQNYKGYQGEFATVGLDYLYSFLFRSGLRLELSLGAGYFYSLARSYQVYEEGGKGYKDKDMAKSIQYFGPLKAGVSLVVPIYCKKGGAK